MKQTPLPNDDGVTVVQQTPTYRITHNPYEGGDIPFTLWLKSIFHENWVIDSHHPTEQRATKEAQALGVAR